MKKLIETILNDLKITEYSQNSKVKQLIEVVNSLSEGEYNNLMEEFGEILENTNDKNRTRDLFEYIYKEREGIRSSDTKFMNNLSLKTATPSLLNGSICSYLNSPEKQSGDKSGGTRWSVSREDRRKILEQMERYREDQKRRKKQDWCRLTRSKSEFDELWESDGEGVKLNEKDLMLMRIDEGVTEDEAIKGPEVKRSRQQPEDRNKDREYSRSQQPNKHQTQRTYLTQQPTSGECQIVDFDCIENLLISLSNDRSLASSANFILNCSENIYKSEVMFYDDLKEFDQPYFLYYVKDDDLSALKLYEFSNDDLGKYARNRSYNDKSKKFYQERAYRHRYMSRKPYEFFFKDFEFKRLREEMENLANNCREFDFWLTKAVAKKGTVFVSSGPLLRSFSLLLVLSRLVQLTTLEISNSIWSHRKFGPEWTLQEILKIQKGNFGYLTREKSSKLSMEAAKLGMKFI